MATVTRTISSFSVYSGYDQSSHLQSNYLAYSNSFVIPNENLSSVTVSLTFTGIDTSDNELSSAVSTISNCLFIKSSQVGSGNSYSGNNTSQLSDWTNNKGQTVCLEWLHRNIVSDLAAIDNNAVNYIVSGYVKFVTSSGKVTKIYLGSNALPVCYLGANRIERIYLGSNLIASAGTKTSHSSTFSGTINSKGIYSFSKNLGTNVDSGTIRTVIDTGATLTGYNYNPSNGSCFFTFKGTAGAKITGTIYYNKYS